MIKTIHKLPKFLFCEIPIKEGVRNDNRIWIYHPKTLSLMEFICLPEGDKIKIKDDINYYSYFHGELIEEWFGVFIQNNCEQFNANQETVLKKAWDFLYEYITWKLMDED